MTRQSKVEESLNENWLKMERQPRPELRFMTTSTPRNQSKPINFPSMALNRNSFAPPRDLASSSISFVCDYVDSTPAERAREAFTFLISLTASSIIEWFMRHTTISVYRRIDLTSWKIFIEKSVQENFARCVGGNRFRGLTLKIKAKKSRAFEAFIGT